MLDIIVCRITNQLYETENDVFIDSWEKTGLKLPSTIRVHKIATLEKSMVEIIMGKIGTEILNKVKTKYQISQLIEIGLGGHFELLHLYHNGINLKILLSLIQK